MRRRSDPSPGHLDMDLGLFADTSIGEVTWTLGIYLVWVWPAFQLGKRLARKAAGWSGWGVIALGTAASGAFGLVVAALSLLLIFEADTRLLPLWGFSWFYTEIWLLSGIGAEWPPTSAAPAAPVERAPSGWDRLEAAERRIREAPIPSDTPEPPKPPLPDEGITA